MLRDLSQIYAVSSFQGDLANAYKGRIERNCGRLFAFLDFDGVPWNNNNAEHAIKALARLRRHLGTSSSVEGMKEYLRLLSISETCALKGARVLDFFRSGEQDIDRFIGRAGRRRD